MVIPTSWHSFRNAEGLRELTAYVGSIAYRINRLPGDKLAPIESMERRHVPLATLS